MVLNSIRIIESRFIPMECNFSTDEFESVNKLHFILLKKLMGISIRISKKINNVLLVFSTVTKVNADQVYIAIP